MKFKLRYIIIFVSLLFTTTITNANERIEYEFDSIVINEAFSFSVSPTDTEQDNWITEIAGGTDKSLTIKVAQFDLLLTNDEFVVSEYIIIVSGENGKVRYLVNGMSKFKNIETEDDEKIEKPHFFEFSSHKKLDGTTVIKDNTPPVREIHLDISYDVFILECIDENGIIKSYVLDEGTYKETTESLTFDIVSEESE